MLPFKKDTFKSARGGRSKLLDIQCRKCETTVALYQKDGPGNLRRMYMDRIMYPDDMVGLHRKPLQDISDLRCPSCSEYLGTPYIYQKEKRKAFRMYQDAIIKKVKKLNK